MIKEALLSEFQHEAENTRKLLSIIPDSVLEYRPQPHLWSIGQLASHIAELYNWYDVTFNQDIFELSNYKYDKGDITKVVWSMTMNNEKTAFPAMPKIQVIRSILYNHLYHHRGELISHLRATGNKVPSLYGPNFEESQQIQG
jgi:uncharacterized damage-inducible protein DinB